MPSKYIIEDKYIQKYLNKLNACQSDEDKKEVLNKLYEDGFEDGYNERDNEFLT